MKEDRSINFGSLLELAVGKWKQMLLTAILFAVMAGLYKAVPLLRQMSASVSQEDTAKSSSVNLGEEYAQENLKAKQNYLEKSLIPQIDPQSEGRATADIAIVFPDDSGDDTVTVANDDDDINVLSGKRKVAETSNYYVHYIENGIDWTQISEDMNTEAVYIKETVSVDNVDYGLGTATITVINKDKDDAVKIRDYVLDQIQKVDKAEASRYGTFDLVISNESDGYTTDPALFAWLANRLAEINTLSSAADTYFSNASKLGLSSVSSAGSTASVTSRTVVREAGRYAAAGFIGGALLFILLYAIYIAAKGRVLSAKEFNARYGISPIAVIPQKDPATLHGFDLRKIKRHADDYSSLSFDTCYKIAAQNLQELSGGKGTVALFGDIPGQLLQSVCDRLNRAVKEEQGNAIRVEVLSDLNRNPDALHTLSGCDAAVIVGRINGSEYGNTDQLVRTVSVYKKEIVGSIIA